MEPQQINPINPTEAMPPAPVETSPFRPWLITGITIVVTGLIVGGGVYLVMSKRLAAERTALERRITDLQNQVAQQLVSGVKIDIDTEPVSTADWKTYQSPEFNIAFKYPPSWILSTTYRDNTIVVSKKPILGSDIPEYRTTLMIINNYWEHGVMGLDWDKKNSITIGGVNTEVMQYRRDDNKKIGLLIINMYDGKRRPHGIEFKPSINEQEGDLNVFYNIISSIKFID